MANFVVLPLVQPSFDRDFVAVDEIRALTLKGFDEGEPEDRALAWLVMLGVYPKESGKWRSLCEANKANYFALAKECGLENWHTRRLAPQVQLEVYDLDTHEKNRIMGIVHGDIVRTGRTMFFLPPLGLPGAVDERLPDAQDDCMSVFAGHARRLERILFVFGSLNIGLGYMQGFNELVVPLYYVLYKAQVILNNDLDLVETLTWNCLQALLMESSLHEFYMTCDKSSTIMHQLEDFQALSRKHLPDAASLIDQLGIHPLLYSFRWFNLLFCQEHELPTLIGIWDYLIANFNANEPIQFVKRMLYVGIGHLSCIQHNLRQGDYAATISALQNMEGLCVKEIRRVAEHCWVEDHKPKKGKFAAFFSGQ